MRRRGCSKTTPPAGIRVSLRVSSSSLTVEFWFTLASVTDAVAVALPREVPPKSTACSDLLTPPALVDPCHIRQSPAEVQLGSDRELGEALARSDRVSVPQEEGEADGPRERTRDASWAAAGDPRRGQHERRLLPAPVAVARAGGLLDVAGEGEEAGGSGEASESGDSEGGGEG
eukprot:747379-Hanusia_phi.AAC.2